MTAPFLAARVYTAIRSAGIVIDSVSIGEDDDRSTWMVLPADQQAAAQPIIDAFVLPTAAELLDEEADRDLNVTALRALARETYDLVPAYAGKPTVLEFFARIKARYKALVTS